MVKQKKNLTSSLVYKRIPRQTSENRTSTHQRNRSLYNSTLGYMERENQERLLEFEIQNRRHNPENTLKQTTQEPTEEKSSCRPPPWPGRLTETR